MDGRRLGTALLAVTLATIVILPVEGHAQSGRDFMGGMAGGLLGGAIAGAIIANTQQRPTVIYQQPQPAYVRRAPTRRYAASPRKPSRAKVNPETSKAAVIDTASDPFAAAKPNNTVTPIPVANKP